MGLEVLLVGRLRPGLGVQGEFEGVTVVDIRHPEAVQSVVALLASNGSPVLIVCEEREAHNVRHQRALLHAALPRVTTLLEPVPGPPLAVSVVGTLVSDAQGNREQAGQLAMLDRLRERMWTAVWLSSVARLGRPAPRMTQHMRSWLPSDGFLALYAEDRVVGVRQGQSIPEIESPPVGGHLVVADSGAPDWLAEQVAEGVRAARRMSMDSWRDPRDAYGVSAAAELVLLPPGADDVDDADVGAFGEC
ncbi:MAG: hypothetical protein ACRDOJ_12965, partial [Nocardioidaceae bacterium]